MDDPTTWKLIQKERAANGRGRRDTARPNAGDDLMGPQRGGLAVLSRMTSSVGSNT